MPDAPTDFVVSHLGIDHFIDGSNKASCVLSWTNNAPDAIHRAQIRLIGGTAGWVDAFRASDGRTAEIIDHLARAASYHVRLRSELADGSFSAWVSLDPNPLVTADYPTSAAQISPATDFALVSNDYRGVTFSWVDNANNETYYIVQIDGPDMAGRKFYVEHLTNRLTLPVGGPGNMRNSTTYTAQIAVLGGKQTNGNNTFVTDWTGELSFTTAAPHIAILNLPLPAGKVLTAYRGVPLTFQVLTNTPATSFSVVSGELPASFTLSAHGMIYGTGTLADFFDAYVVGIRADDASTSDTQTLLLQLLTPTISFTNLPASPVAWNGIAFTFRCITNIAAESFVVVAGLLPTGLTLSGDTVSGTPAEIDGVYTVTIRATTAFGKIAESSVAIQVQTPSLSVLVKPHGSSNAPKAGPDWGEAKSTLGAFFDWDASVRATGPIDPGNALTLDNAPAWLAVEGASFSGTPNESGQWDVGINWSNGTYSARTVLRVRVKPLHITSDDSLIVYEDAEFSFPLTASSPAEFGSPDDLPTGVAISSPEAGAQFLSGVVHGVGDYSFQIVATAGLDQDIQSFTLHVLPLITLGNGTDQIEGWEGEPLLEMLQYHGACEVEHWYLSGAPAGVEIGTLGCPGAYAGTNNIVAITGSPTADGFFDATITAHVCCNGVPELHRFYLRFAINGDLFLAWLHADRTLYDLQFQIRGDVLRRAVQSWYQRAAHGESKSTTTMKDTSSVGVEKDSTTETTEAADSGNILTAKRGDHLRLALLIRDGRQVLGVADGITDVGIAFRLPDSADEEYLFDLPGVPTTVDGRQYFLAEFDVTQELLDDLMDDDAVSGSSDGAPAITALAEIRCTLAGQKISSATFPVTFVEDVER